MSLPKAVRVHQKIFEEFQHRIREGLWLPGDRLPSITQLATELSASAGSVREALRSLQMIGMVDIVHGSGVYVTGGRPSVDLTEHFQSEGDGVAIALAEVRRILEPELAFFAAERATEAELTEIEALARQMIEESKQGQDYSQTDVLFHTKITEAARNPILIHWLEQVRSLQLDLRRAVVLNLNTSLRTLRFHSLIAAALKERQGERARELMKGEMNAMVEDVLASESVKQAIQEL